MRYLSIPLIFAAISLHSASSFSTDQYTLCATPLPPKVAVDITQSRTPDRKSDIACEDNLSLTVTIFNNRSSPLYGYIIARDPSNGTFINLYQDKKAGYIWKPKPDGTSEVPIYFTSGIGQYEIQLPAGRHTTVPLPGYAASGRIYIASDHLQFGTIAGGSAEGLVEPSVSNPSLPEHNIAYQFLEFTYLKDNFYADISNIDFVSLPLSMTVVSANTNATVLGLVANATELICEALQDQTAKDSYNWDKLCIRHESTNELLRVLSPTQYLALCPGDELSKYLDPYVDEGKWLFSAGRNLCLVPSRTC